MTDRILTVRVARITPHTPEVSAFELVHPAGRALPTFEAGAHIDVHLPGGFMRPYSLAAVPADGDAPARYVIGVKREPASRGGSASLHERVRPGDLLAISTPRNRFVLRAEATQHLLLAGGIGLTPLLAMAQQLSQRATPPRAPFTLCVFARSREHLPFAEALAALAPNVRLHLDDAAAPEKLDLHTLLAAPAAGTHLYLCGPAGFMQAARQAAADWPDERVHLEHFAAPDGGQDLGTGVPFELQLLRRGLRVPVAADQSAVDALRELGIAITTSCEQGLCGTCVVGWQAAGGGGAPEHRDFCLSASERQHQVALCCSRARAGVLAIDL